MVVELKQEAGHGDLVVQHSTGSCVREGAPLLGQQTGLSYTNWTGLLSSVSPAEMSSYIRGWWSWMGGRYTSPPPQPPAWQLS